MYHPFRNSFLRISNDSYMMPRKVSEEIPDRMAFTFTPINRNSVQKSMDSKEFLSVSSLINTAISFYYENRGKSSKEDFKAWIVSEDGEQFIKGIVLKIQEEKKTHG